MKGRIQNQKSKIDLPQEVTEEVLRGQDQKLITTEVDGGTRSRSRSKADRSGRRGCAESRGGVQGHFNPGHTSKVIKLLCSSGNNSLSGKLGNLSCSSTYRPEKRRSLFS